jgi:hypothetical protein
MSNFDFIIYILDLTKNNTELDREIMRFQRTYPQLLNKLILCGSKGDFNTKLCKITQ